MLVLAVGELESQNCHFSWVHAWNLGSGAHKGKKAAKKEGQLAVA